MPSLVISLLLTFEAHQNHIRKFTGITLCQCLDDMAFSKTDTFFSFKDMEKLLQKSLVMYMVKKVCFVHADFRSPLIYTHSRDWRLKNKVPDYK